MRSDTYYARGSDRQMVKYEVMCSGRQLSLPTWTKLLIVVEVLSQEQYRSYDLMICIFEDPLTAWSFNGKNSTSNHSNAQIQALVSTQCHSSAMISDHSSLSNISESILTTGGLSAPILYKWIILTRFSCSALWPSGRVLWLPLVCWLE